MAAQSSIKHWLNHHRCPLSFFSWVKYIVNKNIVWSNAILESADSVEKGFLLGGILNAVFYGH